MYWVHTWSRTFFEIFFFFVRLGAAAAVAKEPTVPCDPPFNGVSFAEQTKESTTGYAKMHSVGRALVSTKEPTVPCDPPLFTVSFAEQTKESTTGYAKMHSVGRALASTKEPTVPRSDPPLNGVSFAEQTKESTSTSVTATPSLFGRSNGVLEVSKHWSLFSSCKGEEKGKGDGEGEGEGCEEEKSSVSHAESEKGPVGWLCCFGASECGKGGGNKGGVCW